jgi:L-ascorbate metabolism protein UlaG (beta-lactamase superfamily)
MSSHPRPKFTHLGHSTIRCDMPGGEVLLIDPWVQGNPATPEANKSFERLDAILITHAHGDHMGDAVAIATEHKPGKVVASYEICVWLEDKGVQGCSPMNLGGTQEVLGAQVTMVRADHSSALIDEGKIVYGGNPAGYIVRLQGGYTFYHAGDTALFSDLELIGDLYRPELAFLPIGDLFTMDAQQAARACRYLGVRKVIPIHWGTFPALTGTPEQLTQALGDLGCGCEVVALRPGESY